MNFKLKMFMLHCSCIKGTRGSDLEKAGATYRSQEREETALFMSPTLGKI